MGHVQKRLKKRVIKKVTGSTSISRCKAERIAHLYALVVVQHRGKSASEIREGLEVLLTSNSAYKFIKKFDPLPSERLLKTIKSPLHPITLFPLNWT